MNPSGNLNRIAYLALAAVCLFWGTTYLAIRISLESFPPAYLIAVRYSLSGGALLLYAKLKGIPMPRGREFWLTALCGIVCIGLGNTFLAAAELKIPSGLAALFYTTAPFWMVGIDAFLPEGKKPLFMTLIGLGIGMFGVAYLIFPSAVKEGFHGATLPGFILMQISAACWTLGSLLQKRVSSLAPPFLLGAVQQIAASFVCGIAGILFAKWPDQVSGRATLAILYLVTIGSIVGYSAFIYSVKHLPVAIVSVYYFINPLVAVFLGWLFFREPFGLRAALAMAIIFAGVALVRWSEIAKA